MQDALITELVPSQIFDYNRTHDFLNENDTQSNILENDTQGGETVLHMQLYTKSQARLVSNVLICDNATC